MKKVGDKLLRRAVFRVLKQLFKFFKKEHDKANVTDQQWRIRFFVKV